MRALVLFFFGISIAPALYAQGMFNPHAYMDKGSIEHQAGAATVKAARARPLGQAITAVREEYGWIVDYEDPPYQGTYLMDMTNPSYRAAHPDTPVVLGPAGGPFQSTYPEPATIWSSSAEEQTVLEKIVSDYNRTANPGKFVVRRLSDGSFDVIGDSVHNAAGADIPVTPILDTVISIPVATRTAGNTIKAIFDALSAKTGVRIQIGLGPWRFLAGGSSALGGNAPTVLFTIGGNGIPARNLLMQAMPRSSVWSLVYEPPEKEYLLSIEPARLAWDRP